MSTRLGRRVRVALVRRCCMPGWPLRPSVRRIALDIEREARGEAGMPWRHPESMIRPLRERYEVRLAELAARTWPNDEYDNELYEDGGNS